MTTKDDYTEKEWQFLVFAPSFSANGMATTDGRVDSEETLTVTDALLKAKNTYAQNELILAVIDELPKILAEMNIPGELRYVKTRDEALWAFGKIARIVDEKATVEEAKEYKQFLVDIIESVARASGKKLIFFGDEIGKEESNYLSDVSTALRLS